MAFTCYQSGCGSAAFRFCLHLQMDDRAYYRSVLLLFNCLLLLAANFSQDIPIVLQDQFQGNQTCSNLSANNGTVDCVLGLGLSPQQYNSLIAVSSWASAAVSIMSGYFIDKLGNSLGLYVFSFLCISGASLCALGSHFEGTPHLLPLMLIGRFLFGSGSTSLLVLQDRITAIWFKDKELGLAFGLTLGVSRLGSVLNFLVTQSFEKEYGMQWTLWGGALLCVIGLFVAMIVSTLDKIGMRRLGQESVIREESSNMSIQDLKLFPLRFWLLTLSTVFFYNIIFPFLANASEFFYQKYSGYSRKEGAYIAGTVYGLSLDYVGLRAVFFMASSVLTLVVFGLLAFTYVPPLVSTIILGVTYSCAGACTWPSIALVVPQATVGTALGLVLSLQMAGNGVCNLIIGSILGTTPSQAKIPLWRWQRMMIFMMANIACCLVTSVLLNIVDHRQGGTLNKTTKKAEPKEGEALEKAPSETR